MTEVRPVTATDQTAVDEWFRIRSAWALELPGHPGICRTAHRARLTAPWPDEQEDAYLAVVDGVAVGYLSTVRHELDNRDVLGCELAVHPDHRGHGHGAALLAHATELAAGLGCSRLLGELPMDGPGATWARARGARPVLELMHRRLDLAAVDRAGHDRLLAEARGVATGYTLLQWTSPTPEEHLAGRAVLEGLMSTDPPLDDLRWEPESFDADRMRGIESMVAAWAMRQYTSAARHDGTGQLVGTTTLTRMDTLPEHVDQWETIVLEEHRGHRLGMLLKIANLRFAEANEPRLRYVDTVNADSNAPMLRVNLALGFQPVRAWAEWELVLA